MNKILGKINKKAILSLSVILLLSMTLFMAFAQTASAQVGIPQPRNLWATSASHQHLWE